MGVAAYSFTWSRAAAPPVSSSPRPRVGDTPGLSTFLIMAASHQLDGQYSADKAPCQAVDDSLSCALSAISGAATDCSGD
jgi:hypothetical protein